MITEVNIDTSIDIPQSVIDYWSNPDPAVADKIKDVSFKLILENTNNSHAFADAIQALNPDIQKEDIVYKGELPEPDITVTTNFGVYPGFGSLTATIEGVDAQLANFKALILDDQIVDPSNYQTASGSTIITLNESYLKTFKNGSYTFYAVFLSGTTPLTLVINGLPTTGDSAPYLPALSLLGASGLLLLTVAVLRRRPTDEL
jgi:hypothetical protein